MNTRLIVAALAVAPHAHIASAQSADQNAFYLISGKDTIIAERVTRTPGELRGEFLDRARGGRMEYVATLTADASITKLATRYYRGAADTVGDRATFEMAGDHVVAQMGAASPANVPSIAGALPIVNPSVAFLEQIGLRAKAISGGDTVHAVQLPLFILGAPQPVPATITFVHTDSVTLAYAGVVMRLVISPAGRIVSGLAPAQGVIIARGPAMRSLASERRDYGAPPGAPYMAEEVTVRTAAGVKLTGTLTLPTMRPSGRVPAIVTITGSGPEDRDEASVTLGDYRPFRELADTLGRRGIAVLRLDDRGVNGSDLGLQSVTSADFADDIRAGVAYLRTRGEIDPARIGLVGHSEGGIIAPVVAESDPRLAGIVHGGQRVDGTGHPPRAAGMRSIRCTSSPVGARRPRSRVARRDGLAREIGAVDGVVSLVRSLGGGAPREDAGADSQEKRTIRCLPRRRQARRGVARGREFAGDSASVSRDESPLRRGPGWRFLL